MAETWRCRLFGHDYVFTARETTLEWECTRECGAGGSRSCATTSRAEHCATAFNRRDVDSLGRRAPLVGLFPLRMWRRLASRDGA